MSAPTSATSALRKDRPIVVQKYGGSSVADVEKLGRVADRVAACRREGNDVVVVVSAMGKTTDGLLELARQVALVDGAQKEPVRRELDMLVTTGERVSMSLLSIALGARGVPAISFTGSQSGILTNDRHFDARIIEVRPHRIEDELYRGQTVIVAGYQGMSYKREITTLGRGGSDTTAVALAAALRAERCEIYSDVDGVYSADPRVVADAKHLPELNLAVLQEMAESGAKVVCAQAVEWAVRAGITIHARSTFGSPRETVVQAGVRTPRARAVASESNVVWFSWKDAELGRVVRALAELELPYKDLSHTGSVGSLVIPLSNVPHAESALGELSKTIAGAHLENAVTQVSALGDGLATDGRTLSEWMAALDEAGISPLRVTSGPLRISALVPTDQGDSAVRAIHERLVTRAV